MAGYVGGVGGLDAGDVRALEPAEAGRGIPSRAWRCLRTWPGRALGDALAGGAARKGFVAARLDWADDARGGGGAAAAEARPLRDADGAVGGVAAPMLSQAAGAGCCGSDTAGESGRALQLVYHAHRREQILAQRRASDGARRVG